MNLKNQKFLAGGAVLILVIEIVGLILFVYNSNQQNPIQSYRVIAANSSPSMGERITSVPPSITSSPTLTPTFTLTPSHIPTPTFTITPSPVPLIPTAEIIPTEYIPSPPLLDLRQLSPDEFVNLVRNHPLPGLVEIVEPPYITGDIAADQRIRDLALYRGYILRKEANRDLVNIQGFWLQNEAAEDFLRMQAEAEREGIYLGIVSAYRSVDNQRDIFLQRFAAGSINLIGREYSFEEIAQGLADEAILGVLDTSSIPGYSNHHSGYAIDLKDTSTSEYFTRFANTQAYTWMSANNYYNAKRFGFVPAYPAGAVEGFGPMPEPWEYYWVGGSNFQ